MIEMKCRTCGEEKGNTFFYKYHDTLGYQHMECKNCFNEMKTRTHMKTKENQLKGIRKELDDDLISMNQYERKRVKIEGIHHCGICLFWEHYEWTKERGSCQFVRGWTADFAECDTFGNEEKITKFIKIMKTNNITFEEYPNLLKIEKMSDFNRILEKICEGIKKEKTKTKRVKIIKYNRWKEKEL